MQIGVVGIVDAAQAAQIDAHAPDLLAWIETLEPPAYPRPIDEPLAAQGKAVFEQTCAGCHGTYGETETYPNLWLPADVVGTDPEYARFFAEQEGFIGWFNDSWYSTGGTYVDTGVGYVAPPLDGIWASAPYLHNGSVPTLAALLDSKTRPVRWRRDYGSSAYDFEALGWPVESREDDGTDIYNTTAFGFSASGHVYGDGLSGEERRAVLEYLKTL